MCPTVDSMSTPLHLDKYFFPVAQSLADPQFKANGGTISEFHPEIKLNYKAPEKGNLHQVALEISVMPEDEESLLPYTVSIVVVGMFRVAEDWDDPVKMILVNGASILYSAAREFIITITSRGPWSPLIIPAYNFLQHYEENHAAKDRKDKRETEQVSDVGNEE